MNVTVAIPTTLESRSVCRTVESALKSAALCEPDSEVLVAVNGATDGDQLAGLASPQLRVLQLSRRSAPGARNAALAAARNDTVLFADDDCTLPPSWCRDLGTALASGNHPVVAAPVQVQVNGPVTAFVNYQRLFDAPSDGGGGALYPVTANCGVRRSLLPAGHAFDDINFNNAAEDIDFGLTLRQAGHTIGWLADGPPVVHQLSESVDEISARWRRYGRAHVRLHTRKQHRAAALPGALKWYRRMAAGADVDFRRFSEVVDTAMREACVVYDLVLHASFLIGYLEELGAEWGYPLIHIDQEGLAAGWRAIADQLTAPASAQFAPDYSRLGLGAAARNPVPSWFPMLLRRCAKPVAVDPAGAEFTEHAARTEEFETTRRAVYREALGIWTMSGASVGDAWMADRALRAAGVSFREGCHELETLIREAQRKEVPCDAAVR